MRPDSHPVFPWRCLLLGLSLVLSVATGPGCQRQTPAPSPPANTPAATNPPPAPATTNAHAPEVLPIPQPQQLLAAFQTAPDATRQRVQSALQSFQAGQTQEAIGQMKRLDADTQLSPQQQQAIADWIRSTRR